VRTWSVTLKAGHIKSKISGYHGGEYEEDSLLGSGYHCAGDGDKDGRETLVEF